MALYDVGLAGGKSAYQYALEGGYKGTEAEFTEALGDMSDIGITLTETLTSGETSLTFTDDRITIDSVLNAVYATKFGLSVQSVIFNDGSVTIEFPSQEENVGVKVVINANLALGSNGKSLYDCAVDDGYEGTQEEFIETILNDKAEKIKYDNNVSGMNADNVQGAIDEVSRTIGYSVSKNLLPCNGKATENIANLTYTVNSDMSITVNGNNPQSYDVGFLFIGNINNNTGEEIKGLIDGKEYTLSGCPEGGAENKYYIICMIYNKNGERTMCRDIGNGVKFTHYDGQTYRVNIGLYGGTTVNNLTFYPMISKDGGEFEPYVADLKTLVANNYESIFVDYRKTFATKTSQVVYQKVVDRKCLVHLTHNGFYGAGFMTHVDIYGNGKLMAMNCVHPAYTPNMSGITCSASFVLEKGQSINCNAKTNADGEHTGNITGYIQYLE